MILQEQEEEVENINETEIEIDTAEELEQKKQEINKFEAKENSAQNQIFIQDMGDGSITLNCYMNQINRLQQDFQ